MGAKLQKASSYPQISLTAVPVGCRAPLSLVLFPALQMRQYHTGRKRFGSKTHMSYLRLAGGIIELIRGQSEKASSSYCPSGDAISAGNA
jgi:hypothetical protein